MSVNFEYYKVFYYVATAGSITAAAKKLFLTQPTISHYIQSLEKELDCSLFLRTKKGVIMTPEAKQLYSHIALACEHIFEAEQQLENAKHLMAGTITIGASETTLHHFIMPYLKEFRARYPNIKIKISNSNTPAIMKLLTEGLLDFAVLVVNDDIRVEKPFFQNALDKIQDIFIAGSEYAHLKDQPLSLEELKSYPLICLEKGTMTRSFLTRFLLDHKIDWDADVELDSHELIRMLVMQNFGIGFIPNIVVSDDIEAGDVFHLKINSVIPERRISLISNPNTLSLSSKAFISLFDHLTL